MPNYAEFHDQTSRDKGPKAILFDYDFLNFADYGPDDTCLYCLTNRQVQIILALLPYVGWQTRWFSTTETTIDTDLIEGIQGDLAARLMSDVCTEILDKLTALDEKLDTIVGKEDTIIGKEDDLHALITSFRVDMDTSQGLQDVAIAGLLSEMTGIIEPSIALLAAAVAGIAAQTTSILSDVEEIGDDVDNIETVITDADDGLVEVSQDVDDIELVVAKLKNSVTNITNITNITLSVGVPDLTFTSATQDTTQTEIYARYNALCENVISWILIEGYAVMDLLNASPSDLATLAATIDAWAINFNYGILGHAGAYTAATIFAAFSDSTAVDTVACAMIDYLKDLTPNAANFSAALSAYTPPGGVTNEGIIYDTLVLALADLNAWQVFAGMMQASFDAALAANPTGYICPACITVPGGLGVYGFTNGSKQGWLIVNGKMTKGLGIESVNTWVPASAAYHALAKVEFPMDGSIAVAHIKVTVADDNNPEGRGTTGANRQSFTAMTYLVAGVPTRFESGAQNIVSNATTTLDFSWAGAHTPSLIEWYTKLDVWHHWITQIELT